LVSFVAGNALLLSVEDFVRTKTGGNYNLVATTLAILEDANKFYQSRGFEMSDEATVGRLLMRTFVKSVSTAF
jgi:hypothetical protein